MNDEQYEPTGIARTVEAILLKAGFDAIPARQGPNAWHVQQGSACIQISYYEPAGLLAGDAVLCTLPTINLAAAYEFLMRQNYELESLSFSVRNQQAILSLVIFDRYLNVKTGLHLFNYLFERADYYDNILQEQYGGILFNWDSLPDQK